MPVEPSADAWFTLMGHGFQTSDVIAFFALVISAASYATTRAAGRRSEAREKERHEREKAKDKEEKERAQRRSKPSVEILDVLDDNEGPGPQRHIRLRLKMAEDGIADIIRRCDILNPKSHGFSVTAQDRQIAGNMNTVIFNPPVVTGHEPVEIYIIEHYLAAATGQSAFLFEGVRQDAAHSKTVFNVTVGAGRPI